MARPIRDAELERLSLDLDEVLDAVHHRISISSGLNRGTYSLSLVSTLSLVPRRSVM
jgi:hypothetical protein